MNMNSKQYIKTVYLLLSLSVQYEYEIKTVYEIENSISKQYILLSLSVQYEFKTVYQIKNSISKQYIYYYLYLYSMNMKSKQYIK